MTVPIQDGSRKRIALDLDDLTDDDDDDDDDLLDCEQSKGGGGGGRFGNPKARSLGGTFESNH